MSMAKKYFSYTRAGEYKGNAHPILWIADGNMLTKIAYFENDAALDGFLTVLEDTFNGHVTTEGEDTDQARKERLKRFKDWYDNGYKKNREVKT